MSGVHSSTTPFLKQLLQVRHTAEWLLLALPFPLPPFPSPSPFSLPLVHACMHWPMYVHRPVHTRTYVGVVLVGVVLVGGMLRVEVLLSISFVRHTA